MNIELNYIRKLFVQYLQTPSLPFDELFLSTRIRACMLSQSKPTIRAVCACGAQMTRGTVDIAQCYEVLHSHCRQIKTIHKCGSSHQSRCSKAFCGHAPFRWSVDRVFLGFKNPGLKNTRWKPETDCETLRNELSDLSTPPGNSHPEKEGRTPP